MSVIKNKKFFFTIFPVLLLLSFSSCGPNNPSATKSEAVKANILHPAPSGDLESIPNQLKRYQGQKSFLNPIPWNYRFMDDRNDATASASDSRNKKESREIEESDIFKIGKPGSKLLYLLNNYRGLQTVSFKEGAEHPQLLSRTGATGNWPQNMYYDEDQDRLIVLETVWSSNYKQNSSRLLVYDVADPQQVKISQIHNIEGTLQDSRRVGNVLYIATQVNKQGSRPYYEDNENESSEATYYGVVTSFSLAQQEIRSIATYQLKTPLEYGELMNIVEVKKGEDFHYYLLAVLRPGISWRSSHNKLAVVDISSNQGEITPLLEVDVKGTIRERSQAGIKDNTLIAASNYNGLDNNLRIAVESFKLPSAGEEEILEKEEADYRRFLLNKAIQEKIASLQQEGLTPSKIDSKIEIYQRKLQSGEELYKGHQLILKNRYIKGSDGMFQALMSNSFISVGSTENLHATIRDVRFDNNKLYVYWVPQNMIDPLDVFDISHPEKEIHYSGRLIFDGWIERAIPLRFNNEDYIIGLGHIVPSLNNEGNRRYPQAMLFKISTTASGAINKEIISQMTLQESNVWVDFNSADKFIELKFDSQTGTGAIMFQVYQWEHNKSYSGGKLIGLNINQAISGRPSQVFTEGGLLKASSDWLRRVFTNSEIDKINTFTDKELSIFDLNLNYESLGGQEQVFSAMKTLELARNIKSHFHLAHRSHLTGVQVISDDYYYYNYDNDQALPKTKLRFVDPNKADSEKSDILQEKILKGSYAGGLSLSSHSQLILTEHYVKTTSNNYELKLFLSLINLTPSGEIEVSTWPFDLPSTNTESTPPYFFRTQEGLQRPPSGEIYLTKGTNLFKVQISNQQINLQPFRLENCHAINGRNDVSLILLKNDFYLNFYDLIQDERNPNLQYQRNFINRIAINGQQLTCGQSINIPGTPITIDQKNLITSDLVLRNVSVPTTNQPASGYGPRISVDSNLTSLRLSDSATLVDLFPMEKMDVNSIKQLKGNTFVFLESNEPIPFRGHRPFVPMSLIARPYYPANNQEISFSYLSLNNELRFTKESYYLDLSVDGLPDISKIVSLKNDSYYGVIRSGKKVQVLKFSLTVPQPEIQKLISLNSNLQRENERSDLIETFSSYGYWNTDSAIDFIPQNKSIVISEGNFGITQFFIEK